MSVPHATAAKNKVDENIKKVDKTLKKRVTDDDGPDEELLRSFIRRTVDKGTLDAVRKHIMGRSKVLDKTRHDSLYDGEAVFDTWQEYEALTWNDDTDKGGDELQRKWEQEYVYLYLSSAMRDVIAYPSPGYFKISLTSEIDNIIKAELVQASFPLTDPTVNSSNNIVRYSFAPHTGAAVQEVEIPQGSYTGEKLAIEITRQMNQNLYAVDILANTYIINDEGLAVDPGTLTIPAGLEQFQVLWNVSTREFIFRYIDSSKLSINTPDFALHVQIPDLGEQVVKRFLTDDLYTVLGFNRVLWARTGTYDPVSDTYYIVNTQSTLFNGLFGVTNSVDERYRYSINSNQAADLRGNIAVILDIMP